MKTDFSQIPREEIEAQITMMMLGELPTAEADALRQFVATDAELTRVMQEMEATIGFVREAVTTPVEEKLSTERRERVLSTFKVVQPIELAPQKPREHRRSTLALAAMVAFLLTIAGLIFGGPKRSYKARMEVASAPPVTFSDGAIKEPENIGLLERPDSAGSSARDRGRSEADVKLSLAQDSEPSKKAQLRANIELPAASVDEPVQTGVPAKSAKLRDAQDELANLRLKYTDEHPAVKEQLKQVEKLGSSSIQETQASPTGNVYGVRAVGYVGRTLNSGSLPIDSVATDQSNAQSTGPRGYFAGGGGRSAGRDDSLGIAGGLGFGEAKQSASQVALNAPDAAANEAARRQPLERQNRGEASNAIDEWGFKERGTSETNRFIARFESQVPNAPVALAPPMSAPVPGKSLTQADKTSEEGLAEQKGSAAAANGGGTGMGGGGGTNSMMYYRQNPEMMKRYFPQLYQQMQQQNKKPEQLRSELSAGTDSAAAMSLPKTEVRDLQRGEQLGREATEKQADLKELKASIDQRILQEKVDAAVPRGGVVEVVDPAKAEGPSESGFAKLRRSLGGRVERSAKIEIPKQVADASSVSSDSEPAKSSYDPYFVQSEFEKIKSQQTLTKVVDELNLSAKWKVDRKEAIARLRKDVTVQQDKNSSLYEVRAKGAKPEEAAEIANTVVEVYRRGRLADKQVASQQGVNALAAESEKLEKQIAQKEPDIAVRKPAPNAAIPQPEVATTENAFSTFSLNVSDVSFKLAQASLERGQMPDAATVRSEEFINAFDYHDPEPQGAPIGFTWERARYPFAQGRDLLRFSVKTAASGRQANQPMNIVLLLDSSGSMERADRVRIIRECMRTLAGQLHAGDKVSVVAFARTARLWVDGLAGEQAGDLPQRVGNLTPEGGTNLEEALRVAYETARKHFVAGGVNRVVLLTDGAANLGDVEPDSLKRKVEEERKRGVALDAFGIGWEGLDDQLLEALSRNGDGRYGFVNTPEAAGTEFAGQLAGALHVAASDVKVQVEFNPKRVTAYRQIGYAKHQLTKEQFRDNTVDAAELGAAEAGNALYVVQVNPAGEGPLGAVRVRFKVPGTNDYREQEWPLTYEGATKPLENAPYTMRLAATASGFSEWLVTSPYAAEVTTDKLLTIFAGVPEHFAPDPRPTKLEWMIRQAKSLTAK